MEDNEIVKRFKEGDVLSFDRLFNKYHKKVYYFALSYLKNKEDAEEIVQEVFLSIWRCREQINEYYAFNRYLFKITYNAICKSFRKQASNKKQAENLLKEMVLEDGSTNIEIEYNNLFETARSYIEKLPVRQKSVLLLSINEQFTNEQIAKKLNISKKTVDNHLTKAKAFLKKSLINCGILSILFYWLIIK